MGLNKKYLIEKTYGSISPADLGFALKGALELYDPKYFSLLMECQRQHQSHFICCPQCGNELSPRELARLWGAKNKHLVVAYYLTL